MKCRERDVMGQWCKRDLGHHGPHQYPMLRGAASGVTFAGASGVLQMRDDRLVVVPETAMQRELARIRWRQRLLATPDGLAWLVANAARKERDVGPHRADAPEVT